MMIDIRQIQKKEGGVQPFSCELTLSGQNYLGQEYRFDAPFKVSGEIVNYGSVFELKAAVSGSFLTDCDRCLEEIRECIDFSFEEKLVRTGSAADDEAYFIEGHEVDLEDIVLRNFFMEVSFKHLCSPDCKGICPQCGKNLNDGECGCQVDMPDPRLSVLSEFKEEK